MKTVEECCPKCGEVVNFDKHNISKGYYAVCLKCDEDFYKFELKPKIIKKSITTTKVSANHDRR